MREQGPVLAGPNDFRLGGRSIVASAKGSEIQFNYENDILQLAELAHAAFPQIPLLGFDIVREVPTGKLFVLEANAIGYVWSFGAKTESSFGLPLGTAIRWLAQGSLHSRREDSAIGSLRSDMKV